MLAKTLFYSDSYSEYGQLNNASVTVCKTWMKVGMEDNELTAFCENTMTLIALANIPNRYVMGMRYALNKN
uniref:Oxidoreductase n=1 Tax=Heterorhabditis bacteriophora TaxID=37862 RepID=A0A1I7XEQ2_HETBA